MAKTSSRAWCFPYLLPNVIKLNRMSVRQFADHQIPYYANLIRWPTELGIKIGRVHTWDKRMTSSNLPVNSTGNAKKPFILASAKTGHRYHWREPSQVIFCRDKHIFIRRVLSRQRNICCDKNYTCGSSRQRCTTGSCTTGSCSKRS